MKIKLWIYSCIEENVLARRGRNNKCKTNFSLLLVFGVCVLLSVQSTLSHCTNYFLPFVCSIPTEFTFCSVDWRNERARVFQWKTNVSTIFVCMFAFFFFFRLKVIWMANVTKKCAAAIYKTRQEKKNICKHNPSKQTSVEEIFLALYGKWEKYPWIRGDEIGVLFDSVCVLLGCLSQRFDMY